MRNDVTVDVTVDANHVSTCYFLKGISFFADVFVDVYFNNSPP